jgi:hypothetical protein
MSGGDMSGADGGGGADGGRDAGERADYHVRKQAERRARESAKAQALVDEFVRAATAAGLATTELHARPWSGSGRYRTGVTGWYLKRDRSIGIDTTGGYFVLVVPPERLGRWRGVSVAPSDPPLQVGEGARDGESAPLADYLQWRLEAGDEFR